MRVASLLLLLSTGCASWSGVSAARHDLLAEALEAERLPLGVEQAAALLQATPPLVTSCRPEAGALRCETCGREGCAALLGDGLEARVTGAAVLTERELSAVWSRLSPRVHREVLAALPALLPSLLLEQERRFEPRFGFTGGVLASASGDGTAVALGLRAGLRRWFDPHLVGHAALEYRWRGDHEVHLRAGLEVSRWSPGRFWGAVGAPPFSAALFIGPVLRAPLLRAGVRTGVGFHVTDLRSAPLFVELSADTFFAGEGSRLVGTFTFGVGL